MNQNINRKNFAQTMYSFSLPHIVKEETRQFKNGANKSSKIPNISQNRNSMDKTFINRHTSTTWEYTYKPKTKKDISKKSYSNHISTTTTISSDWSLTLRQTNEEESVCRRLMIANETIERQRLFRLLQGKLPEMDKSFTENEERGNRLLSLKDYAGAHVCFSRAIRHNSNSKILYYRRAICNWYLMLYDDCIEDCRKGLELDYEILSILCRSLVLRERYQEAREWYNYGLQKLVTSPEDAYNIKWKAEYEAITPLQKFNYFIEQKKWEDSVRLKDAAKPLIDGTPLIIFEAKALLYINPEMARLRVLPYVPTIPYFSYSSNLTSKEISLEEKEIWRNVEEHYLQSTVLLAQINAYCGTKFLALSAALIKTCLTINPNFSPALVLGHYIVSLEELFTQITSLFQQERYNEIITIIHDGLKLDRSNRLICSLLYRMRAEAYASLGKDIFVINDCTSAIEKDPKCAEAYVLRAEAFRKMNQRTEAALDRLRAVKLNSTFRYILHGDEEQYLQQQQKQESAEGLNSPRSKQTSHKGRKHWYDSFTTKNEFEFESKFKNDKFYKQSYPKSNFNTTQTTKTMTLYDILELHSGASIEDVRTQFKKLTLMYHPDRVIKESLKIQEIALERFKLINHAHEILTDPGEKFLYDLSIGIRVFSGQ